MAYSKVRRRMDPSALPQSRLAPDPALPVLVATLKGPGFVLVTSPGPFLAGLLALFLASAALSPARQRQSLQSASSRPPPARPRDRR